jgi:uncharacterized protein (DUF924 family)
LIDHLASKARDPAAAQILRFWFGEGAEYGARLKRWFEKQAAFDASCRSLFLPTYERLLAGGAEEWLEVRADCVARIVALDQFPRNIFRGAPSAFAGDGLALHAARLAVERGYDVGLLPVERLFVYLPFEHSESLSDQLTACALTEPLAAFPETEDAHRYAVAHRVIVERFGRFPHRNAILGRTSTAEEIAFLKEPGSSF